MKEISKNRQEDLGGQELRDLGPGIRKSKGYEGLMLVVLVLAVML